jgi:hypothetical protein
MNMSKQSKRKVKLNEIKPGTRRAIDTVAYEFHKNLLDLAFKKDGFRGVVQLSIAMAQEADAWSHSADEEGAGEELSRAIAANGLVQEWYPKIMAEVEKLSDDVEEPAAA